MDVTWLRCLVMEMHDIHPGVDACVLREHPLERDVVLRCRVPGEASATSAELVRRSAERVSERLRKLEADFIVDEGRQRGLCRVSGSNFWSYANLLRRSLLTRIPAVACDQVLIKKHDATRFPDELLAHRFGQIALTVAAGRCLPGQTLPSAKISVTGRPVLSSDLELPSELSLAQGNGGITILPLREGESFSAEVFFAWGTGGVHSKFACVASPSFEPELRLSNAGVPSDDVVKLTDRGFVVGAGGHISHPNHVPRRERILEILRDVTDTSVLAEPTWVDVGWESLGQYDAAECLRLALQTVRVELSEVLGELVDSMAAESSLGRERPISSAENR